MKKEICCPVELTDDHLQVKNDGLREKQTQRNIYNPLSHDQREKKRDVDEILLFHFVNPFENPMPIATINYPSIPSNQSKISQRYSNVFVKPRRSFVSDVSTRTSVSLPPLKFKEKRPNSIRINGKQIFESNSGRSSKLIRVKFGHPFKQRSSEFYRPILSQSELILRENSFVNDSIRSSHQSRRSSIIPKYNSLDDPFLNEYFQSSFVVEMVKKTLQIDLNQRKTRSKTTPKRNDDFRRIVAKKSSGYGRLNGYDCLPPVVRRSRQNSVNSSFQSSSTDRIKRRQPLPPLAHSSPIGKFPSDE